MFDGVAKRYDLLNRVISLSLDVRWRKKALRFVQPQAPQGWVLDLGTGTGDFAFLAARAASLPVRVVGLDFSLEMLRLAKQKGERKPSPRPAGFVLGNALAPPFREGVFDGVMTAFVLRNVSDLGVFFVKAHGLLRPGGKLASLDMFPPPKGVFAFFYALYFYHLVPWIGAGLGGDRGAYRYLSDSVRDFGQPETVVDVIRRAGFEEIQVKKFLRGAVCLHLAVKPAHGIASPQAAAGSEVNQ